MIEPLHFNRTASKALGFSMSENKVLKFIFWQGTKTSTHDILPAIFVMAKYPATKRINIDPVAGSIL